MCLLELQFSDLAPQRVDQSDLVSKSGEHVSRHAEHENTLSVKTEKQSEKRSSPQHVQTEQERERERNRKREEMTIRYSAYEIHVMMRRSEMLMINDDDDN